MSKVIFVGAGPGDPDLITIKGRTALETADVVVYAGSLIPPALLAWARPEAEMIDSAPLTLEEITEIFARAVREGRVVVRLHSGDPSIYGAIQEQIDWLVDQRIDFEIIPGVTAAFAAAAAIGRELTIPEISQAVIFARVSGRTPVPDSQDLDSLARTKATLCLYLSVQKIDEAAEVLLRHYPPTTPAAVVYHASRPDEKVRLANLADLAAVVAEAGITSTALVLIGPALAARGNKSRLYDKEFSHGRRR